MRKWLLLSVILTLAVTVPAGAAQAKQKYGIEEFNALQDINNAQAPNQKMQFIQSFLEKHPESVLRAFVYPEQARSAWQLQQYAGVIEAVDGFLGLDRDAVADLYRQSKYNDQMIDNTYYQMHLLATYSFLQNGSSSRGAGRAAEVARQGLRLHESLYSAVQPPADAAQRQQFEQQKRQAESAFRTVLANQAWREKNYGRAVSEYRVLVDFTPDDAAINYRLGIGYLRKQPRENNKGMWYLARALAPNIKSDEVRDFLTQSVAAYEQAAPECVADDVRNLIEQSRTSVQPPAALPLVRAEQVNSVRQELAGASVKKIFDDLKLGGEPAHLMWLASCGVEIGKDADEQPAMTVKILEIAQEEDNLVTLRVAAGPEAAAAGTINVEIKIIAPEEAKQLQVNDVVRVAGKITNYQAEPFLLKLTGGVVRAGDIKEAIEARE
ncbi:MAG: hypothetical protein ACE5HB_00735 [Terriglobia bacterium]